MADLTSAAQGASRSIGRYFSIVSTLPSVLLVGWVFLLWGSGAFLERPDPRAAATAVTSLSFGAVGALAVVALALGIVLHPLQFAFVQALEGYWGVSEPAQRWRVQRILRARHRLLWLRQSRDRARDWLVDHDVDDPFDVEAERRLPWISERDEADRLQAARPDTLEATMPTRLGNVLRYYEWQVGAGFGLDAVTAMPYLSRVAAPGDMEYVNDQRSQLDLAVRTMIVSLIAFVLTAVPLATDGLWLLVALVPYTAAYLSYHGAVVAGDEYGRALGVVVTLDRFALYERLRVTLPLNGAEERRLNDEVVNDVLALGEGGDATYDHSDRGSRSDVTVEQGNVGND